MKKIFSLLLIGASLSLCACAPDLNGTSASTISSVSLVSYVCTLSDGRKLYKFEVARSGHGNTDRIYFFKNASDNQPISINIDTPQGKTTVNETIVQIPE